MAKNDGTKESEGAGEPHEEIREVIRRGLKFSEELLAENERLRFKVASLEAQMLDPAKRRASDVEQTVAELKARIRELEDERQRLLDSFKEVETLNRDYQSRYAEIEEEHNNLANLYIASYQLHSTLAFREVTQIIAEIVINLVGVHKFALYLSDGKPATASSDGAGGGADSVLHPIFAEGQEVADLSPITMGQGPVGSRLLAREVVLFDDKSADVRAIVPLATSEELIGCIVVHELLVQKEAFSAVDHELFHLLGAHAATALLTSLLKHRAGPAAAAEALDLGTVRRLLSGEAS